MHRSKTSKIILCIGMGLSIYSCSIRKTDKEKGSEKEAVQYFEDTQTKISEENSKIENSFIKKTDFSDWFTFDYKPQFDQYGQIIPLVIEQTKNGQKEKLIISGANVSGGQKQSNQTETKLNTSITQFNSIITFKTQKTYKSVYEYKTVLKERLSFGPQSIYIICLLGITIVCAVLAFTGHWNWLVTVYNKLKKYFGLLK